MNDIPENELTGSRILELRGKKNSVDPFLPYAWLVEKERTIKGTVEDVGIIFITNRECPFHCLMCDLWKNTTDFNVPNGGISGQIEWALEKMNGVKHVKLYNSGSFFDNRAVPENEYERIAALLKDFETVIVESHPKLINEKCLKFKRMLRPDLHIALGLETIQPEIVRILNKNMTPEDFRTAVKFLKRNGISSRAFILLRPPFVSEEEGIYWAERSIDYAFSSGAECCTIIPVRPGNGTIDYLKDRGEFTPPSIKSLEEVLEYGIKLSHGRVFADTWDLGLFSKCDKCLQVRTKRISDMNLEQKILPPVNCVCN
jgi:radical SAM enzyme (TIGR01210 family)